MRWIAGERHRMMRGASAALATLTVGCAARMAAPESATSVSGLGAVHFPISSSRDAQAGFDRGLALLHHMTYPRLEPTFKTAFHLPAVTPAPTLPAQELLGDLLLERGRPEGGGGVRSRVTLKCISLHSAPQTAWGLPIPPPPRPSPPAGDPIKANPPRGGDAKPGVSRPARPSGYRTGHPTDREFQCGALYFSRWP